MRGNSKNVPNPSTLTAKRRMAKKKAQNSSKDGHSEAEADQAGPEHVGQQYSGLGPDSIVIYSEQSSFEQLSDELCYGFAEDLSYKLRSVIHNSLTKARIMGRNYIESSDVSASFQDFNIDPVLGASSFPNYRTLPDQKLYYMDDNPINLMDVALRREVFIQPARVDMCRMWTMDMERLLRDYFNAMCFALVSSEREVRQVALNQIKLNSNVGPIAEWFYHFAFFLLRKDIIYDCHTLRALDLVVALESNMIAMEIVSDKQMKLLVRLLMQRLLRTINTEAVLGPMIKVLGLLCQRDAIHEMVFIKIATNMEEMRQNFSVPLVLIINELGLDAIKLLIVPNLEIFLNKAGLKPKLAEALLSTYNIIIKHGFDREITEMFYKLFGGALVPMWRSRTAEDREHQEINWHKQMSKARRKITCTYGKRKFYFTRGQVFEDCTFLNNVDSDYEDKPDLVDDKIRFRIRPANRVMTVVECAPIEPVIKIGAFTIGKRPCGNLYKPRDKCCDHSFQYVL